MIRPALRRRSARVFTLALLLIASPASAQQDPLPGLDAWMAQALKDWHVPGLALSVVRNDSLIFARGFGVRNIDTGEPVGERTIFAIGSASKAFTAAAIGLMVDEGRARWDDRAAEHLPGFQLHDPYVTREITLRDLLTHRSGLSRGDLMWYGGAYDSDEILRRVRHLEPSWSFRSTFGYQNIMYLAAGRVVERLTGRTWGEVIRTRFFEPLGMTSSTTSTNALQAMPNVATPHARIADTVRTIAWRNIDNIAPAGSINSNVVEMAAWARLHLGQGEVDGRRILSDSVVRELHTPQMVVRKEGGWALTAPDANFLNYGLGWFLQDYEGRKLIHHGGNIDGNSALVALLPEERIGLVILTNMNSTSLTTATMYHVLDRLLGIDDGRDWSAYLLEERGRLEAQGAAAQASADSARVPGTSPSLPLEQYAGTYTDSMYGDVTIALENGTLVARHQSAFVGALSHWHHDTFRITWEDPMLGTALVTFGLDARGRAVAVRMPQGEFRRVPEEGGR